MTGAGGHPDSPDTGQKEPRYTLQHRAESVGPQTERSWSFRERKDQKGLLEEEMAKLGLGGWVGFRNREGQPREGKEGSWAGLLRKPQGAPCEQGRGLRRRVESALGPRGGGSASSAGSGSQWGLCRGERPACSRLREHSSKGQVPALPDLTLQGLVRHPRPSNKVVTECKCHKGSTWRNVTVIPLSKDSSSSRDRCHRARCSERDSYRRAWGPASQAGRPHREEPGHGDRRSQGRVQG